MPALKDGMQGTVIAAPRVGNQHCGNCKFQGQLPEWPGAKLCQESPAGVTTVYTFKLSQTGFEHATTKDVHFPPAPDHWWCGKWKPRFVNETGDQIK